MLCFLFSLPNEYEGSFRKKRIHSIEIIKKASGKCRRFFFSPRILVGHPRSKVFFSKESINRPVEKRVLQR